MTTVTIRTLASAMTVAALLTACHSNHEAEPRFPDLSSPFRFTPSISSFSASPATIRVGEHATLKADVWEVSASAAVSWTLVVENGSSGRGVVSPGSGTGALQSEFVASHPGEVVFVAQGVDARGAPTNTVRTSLAVLP